MVIEGSGPELVLPVAYRDTDLTVYYVGGDMAASSHRTLLLAAHAVWLGMLGVGLAGMMLAWMRRRPSQDMQTAGTNR